MWCGQIWHTTDKWSEGERQRLQSPQEDAAPPAQWLDRYRKSQIGQPLEQRGEGDLGLQACERRPQAVVRALSEGEMPVRLTCQVEYVRIRELALVAISRREHREHQLAAWD